MQKSEKKGHFLSQNIVSSEEEANTGNQMALLREKERKKLQGVVGNKSSSQTLEEDPQQSKKDKGTFIYLFIYLGPDLLLCSPKFTESASQSCFLSNSPQMSGNYSNLNISWCLSLPYLQIYTPLELLSFSN